MTCDRRRTVLLLIEYRIRLDIAKVHTYFYDDFMPWPPWPINSYDDRCCISFSPTFFHTDTVSLKTAELQFRISLIEWEINLRWSNQFPFDKKSSQIYQVDFLSLLGRRRSSFDVILADNNFQVRLPYMFFLMYFSLFSCVSISAVLSNKWYRWTRVDWPMKWSRVMYYIQKPTISTERLMTLRWTLNQLHILRVIILSLCIGIFKIMVT